jgi:pimeloyl-ACP methyl ester carboxylesterase
MLTTVGNSSLVAEKFGTGPTEVVALHGWSRSGADFAKILAPHHGLALHLPGFGPAPEPPTAWSSADYAREIAGALEGMGPLVVVGHSFGGRIAVRLAASYPDLVSHLVLTGVPLTRVSGPSTPKLGFRITKALHRAKLIPDQAMESARQKYGSLDYRMASGVMREILVRVIAEDYLDDATRVSCPVTMVWGEGDKPAPLAAAKRALEFFPQATLRVVSGAEHLLEGTLEQEVASAVADALRD